MFGSLLLRRECCSFSNGEYVKAGLAELEHWCYKATDEVPRIHFLAFCGHDIYNPLTKSKYKCSMQVQPGMSSSISDKLLAFWYLSIVFMNLTVLPLHVEMVKKKKQRIEFNLFSNVGHSSKAEENIG